MIRCKSRTNVGVMSTCEIAINHLPTCVLWHVQFYVTTIHHDFSDHFFPSSSLCMFMVRFNMKNVASHIHTSINNVRLYNWIIFLIHAGTVSFYHLQQAREPWIFGCQKKTHTKRATEYTFQENCLQNDDITWKIQSNSIKK